MADGAELRRALVRRLERAGAISSVRVRNAFLAVPRERFLPGRPLAEVYRDDAILTRRDAQGTPLSSSSQPTMMALMLERLQLAPGQRVLEIGAGTGYNAALLATIAGAGAVVSVELDPETAAEARAALAGYGVEVVTGDGRQGWSAGAPYDRAIVTASAATVPRAWLDQLVEGAILVVPLRTGGGSPQPIPALRKEAGGFRSLSVLCGGFMPLRGEDTNARTEPAVQMGRPRLRPFRGRARRFGLALFLALEAPPGTYVDGESGFGVAVDDSVALVAGDAVSAWGGPQAEELLARLLEEWRSRGRPTEHNLRVSVDYEGGVARLEYAWRE